MAIDLDTLDALTITGATAEAFLSLDWEKLSLPQKSGVILLYDQLMQRVRPLLPLDDPRMALVLQTFQAMERVAASIRAVTDLPPHL